MALFLTNSCFPYCCGKPIVTKTFSSPALLYNSDFLSVKSGRTFLKVNKMINLMESQVMAALARGCGVGEEVYPVMQKFFGYNMRFLKRAEKA